MHFWFKWINFSRQILRHMTPISQTAHLLYVEADSKNRGNWNFSWPVWTPSPTAYEDVYMGLSTAVFEGLRIIYSIWASSFDHFPALSISITWPFFPFFVTAFFLVFKLSDLQLEGGKKIYIYQLAHNFPRDDSADHSLWKIYSIFPGVKIFRLPPSFGTVSQCAGSANVKMNM